MTVGLLNSALHEVFLSELANWKRSFDSEYCRDR